MNFLNKGDISLSQGALYAILAIVMVFVILIIIIGITSLIFKLTGLFELKAELDAKKAETKQVAPVASSAKVNNTNIVDDDMMAAVLVATIDYRKQINKDVRLVNVREIK